MGDTPHKSRHIKLTSHPGTRAARPIPIQWGAADPAAPDGEAPAHEELARPQGRGLAE